MNEYVHGYSQREAQRLAEQSLILEPVLHKGTEYGDDERVLEAGCGVGAQTEILARRSPGACFVSVDISDSSLAKARARIDAGGLTNITFEQADLANLRYPENSFDHVFLCFVLEHTASPVAILTELKRVLKRGGSLTVIEGDHGSAFWRPETVDSRRVWQCLIHSQARLGHNSLVGRDLSTLLGDAGYEIRTLVPAWIYADDRDPVYLDDIVSAIMVPMVESARDQSLALGLADDKSWSRGIDEFAASGRLPDGMFFYTWFKAVAIKPY